MSRARALAAVLAILALAIAGAPAAGGRGVAMLPMEERGLHAVGVGFFTAAFTEIVEEADGKKGARIDFGDLEEVRWRDGVLPTIDAHVLLANLTPLRLVDVPVHVTVYMGVAAQVNMPAVIEPGAELIAEEAFFEATLEVDEILPLALGRVSLDRIRLAHAVAEYERQKLWPVYLRVEATITEVPSEIKLLTPTVSSYLRIYR